MEVAYSNNTVDLSWLNVQVRVHGQSQLRPAVVTIDGGLVKTTIIGNDEQLAEIHAALGQYLESIRYHETPDQQQILVAEHERAIEEGVL